MTTIAVNDSNEVCSTALNEYCLQPQVKKVPWGTKMTLILVISLADTVQEVQSLAHLACHALDNADRDTVVVVTLDDGQQIAAQHLEDHAHVAAVRAHMVETVHKLHRTTVRVQLTPARIRL